MADTFPPFGIRHLALVIAATVSVAAPAQVTAPARNWVLPLFTAEGYRSMIARGSEARAVSNHQFDVTDLNLTLFSGDAAMHIDTIILAPQATFLPDEKRAHGEQSVRVIRDEVEASGTRWIYWHDQKKISLDGDVRVTFQAELKDLLK